jgi:hypothetical protein
VQTQLERQTTQRRLTAAHWERWFGEGVGKDDRLSYRERLLDGGMDEGEVTAVGRLYRRQLADETVAWESSVLYLLAAPTPTAT